MNSGAGHSNAVRGAGRSRAQGFTLIELLFTVAVVAVLAALATPSFTSMINSNRLTGQANEVVTSLQLARSEAIRRNASISLCRSTDGATCSATAGAWTRWLTVDAANNVIRTNEVKAPLLLNSSLQRVTFRGDGLARNAAGALLAHSFTVCINTSLPAQNARNVGLQSGSRVAISSASVTCS